MNQQNAESKLEQAAKEYAQPKIVSDDFTYPQSALTKIKKETFIAAVKSEAAKEYWQSLTTPASTVEEGQTQEPVGGIKNEWQLCPKCNGQGSVSKPPWVPGDVHQWSSTSVTFPCDVCNGAKIIACLSTPPPSPVGIDVDHEAEKEVMMQAFDKVYKMFQARSWIMDGRGSYPYNDDRYKEEVRYLYDEFESLHKDTWANIKSKSVDFRKKVIEQYKKDLENPYFRLSEGFSLPQSSTEEEKELWMALIKEVELNQFVSTKYKDTIEQLQSTYKISKR